MGTLNMSEEEAHEVLAETGRTSSAHPNPKRELCADANAGDFLVICACGKLRPHDVTHAWRREQTWPSTK